MSDADIRFYFDFISHNAYLAWTQIRPLAARFQRAVVPIPVLFAGFLDAYGHLGPAEIAPKQRWMTRNVLRKAAILGIPINAPHAHPFNPLLALRVVSAQMAVDERLTLVDTLFRAVWVEGRDVSDPDVLRQIVDGVDLDGQGLVAQSYEDETKQALRHETEAAIEAGGFGVPTMIVDGELFWGLDDLDFMALFLEGRDPLPEAQWSAWEAVEPAARRRPDLANRTNRDPRPMKQRPLINLDQVPLQTHGHGTQFEARIGSIARQVGARKLGYRLVVVPPGKRAWPFHLHHVNEEMFYVIEGEGTLRYGDECFAVRSGDVIAAPPASGRAHQLINTSAAELRYLAVSTMEAPDVFEYPDSGKFGVFAGAAPGASGERSFSYFGRQESELDYWEGED